MKKQFGQRVRFLRTLEKWTQEQLAEKVGVTAEHLGNIERGGAAPSFELIERLAAALRVDPATMFLFHNREDKLDAACEHFVAGLGVWEYTPAEDRFLFSRGFSQLLGVRERKPASRDVLLHMLSENDRRKDEARWEAVLQGENVEPAVYRLRQKDGGERVVVAMMEAIHAVRSDAEDAIVRVIGVLGDITETVHMVETMRALQGRLESVVTDRTKRLDIAVTKLSEEIRQRRRSQRALEQREALFRQLVETVDGVFYVLEKDGRYSYVSPNRHVLFDGSASAGKTALDDIDALLQAAHEEDRETLRRMFHDAWDANEPTVTIFRLDHDEDRWLEARHFRLLDGHGQVERVVGFIQDITQRQRLARDLIRNGEDPPRQ